MNIPVIRKDSHFIIDIEKLNKRQRHFLVEYLSETTNVIRNDVKMFFNSLAGSPLNRPEIYTTNNKLFVKIGD